MLTTPVLPALPMADEQQDSICKDFEDCGDPEEALSCSKLLVI
jgi:hypothetical protein